MTTKDKTYRELDDIDLCISTRVLEDSPDFNGVQIDMRLRLTEKAKQAIQEHIEGEVTKAMEKFGLKKGVKYDVKKSDSVIVITPAIKQLKDKGGSE